MSKIEMQNFMLGFIIGVILTLLVFLLDMPKDMKTEKLTPCPQELPHDINYNNESVQLAEII